MGHRKAFRVVVGPSFEIRIVPVLSRASPYTLDIPYQLLSRPSSSSENQGFAFSPGALVKFMLQQVWKRGSETGCLVFKRKA